MILKNLGQLRALMLEMETSLGLVELSQGERDVLYAVSQIVGTSELQVRSEAIRSHPLVAGMPPASFHRALRGLLDRGMLRLAPERKSGAYILVQRRLA